MSPPRFFDAVVLLAGASDPNLPELQAWVDRLASRFERGETPTLISTGCCHQSLDIFPGRTEAQITRDLLIDRGIPSSNILCEELSGDLIGRIVHTCQHILIPCGWYHIELILPGATSREEAWLVASEIMGNAGKALILRPASHSERSSSRVSRSREGSRMVVRISTANSTPGMPNIQNTLRQP